MMLLIFNISGTGETHVTERSPELRDCLETLDSGVQVASVAQVLETRGHVHGSAQLPLVHVLNKLDLLHGLGGHVLVLRPHHQHHGCHRDKC